MPSCVFVTQVVSAMVAAVVAMYLGPQTSLAVFDPWRANGPLSFKTPYWRPHTPVSTPGIHLPFPPNDSAPFPSIPYATPHFLLPDVEKLVALAYLNGSNAAASAAASASSAAATASNQRLAAPGSWLPPSLSAVLTMVLKIYGKIVWYTLTVVAHLLAANVLWCRYLINQSVAPVFVFNSDHGPRLPSVVTIETSALGTHTDLTDLLSTSAPAWPGVDNGTQTDLSTSSGSVSEAAWPGVDNGTQTLAPVLAVSGISSMEILPSSPLPASISARQTSEAGTQFSPPASSSGISSLDLLRSSFLPASTPARPTSEAGTQSSPPASSPAQKLSFSGITSIEILPSSPSPASRPAAPTPARPSSEAGSQTSPGPPPARPSFNPGANTFVPNSGPGAFVPPAGGRGGPGNFRGGGVPQFGARGGGGFVPPFGGRGGFAPPFAPRFPGGMTQIPGGAPNFPGGGPHQFPGGAPQFPPGGPPQFPGGALPFAGRGGFASRVPVPFTPENRATFPIARAKPGTPGGPPVATSAKGDWDAWNKRYPQHGKPVDG